MTPIIISMSRKEEMTNGYSFEKKQKLADKINAIRDKPTLKKIRTIILSENPSVTARKNSNGYLMYFQNYTDNTYKKIEKLLNKIEIDKIEQQAKSITETSDQYMMSSDDPDTDYTISRTRLRYSNRERRLIKRQQYEDIISEKMIDGATFQDHDYTKFQNLNDNNSDTQDQEDDIYNDNDLKIQQKPSKQKKTLKTLKTIKTLKTNESPNIVSRSQKNTTNKKINESTNKKSSIRKTENIKVHNTSPQNVNELLAEIRSNNTSSQSVNELLALQNKGNIENKVPSIFSKPTK